MGGDDAPGGEEGGVAVTELRPFKMATGTTGAIGELRVCVDLLKRGYNVFRAVSPSCPCDLMVCSGEQMWRVEVRTGNRLPSGKLSWFRGAREKSDIDAVPVKDEDPISYYDHDGNALDPDAWFCPIADSTEDFSSEEAA